MATTTSIEWADKTWSPIIGCDRVSPGCDNCYAIGTARIRESNPHPQIAAAFAGTTQRTDGRLDWSGQVNLLDDRLTQPLRWRKPARVFVNSMSDLFHANVPNDFIARVFAVMALTPQHTYQILTKRHARMRSLLNSREFVALVDDAREELKPGCGDFTWPLPNVWLGVSVENQKWADIRIPALLDTPAAVRFLSCEPLLGPVDLKLPVDHSTHERDHIDGTPWPQCLDCSTEETTVDWTIPDGPRLHWVIVGGESGPKARAMHPDWARSLRDQCAAADVPYFFKQWGGWGPAPFIVRVCDPDIGWTGTDEELAAAKADSEARGATHVHTGNWSDEDGERSYWLHEIGHKPWSLERVALPEGTAAIRRWGKKRAGRELDGRTHDAFPA